MTGYQALSQNVVQDTEKASLMGRPLGTAPAVTTMPGGNDSLGEPYAGLARPGQFSTGLFDCFSLPGGTGLCCMSFWCPCVQYGMNAEQLPPVATIGNALSRDPDGVLCGGNKWGNCLMYLFLGSLTASASASLGSSGCAVLIPCQVPLHLQLRMFLRRKYGMQGDLATNLLVDTLSVWCCAPCAICQDARELVIRQAVERSEFMSPSTMPPPAPQQQPMVYASVDPRVYAPVPPSSDPYGSTATGVPVTGVPVQAMPPPMPPGKHD